MDGRECHNTAIALAPPHESMRVAALLYVTALLAMPFAVAGGSKGMARSVYVADVAHTSIYHFGLATNTSRTVVDNSHLQGDHGLCGLAFSSQSRSLYWCDSNYEGGTIWQASFDGLDSSILMNADNAHFTVVSENSGTLYFTNVGGTAYTAALSGNSSSISAFLDLGWCQARGVSFDKDEWAYFGCIGGVVRARQSSTSGETQLETLLTDQGYFYATAVDTHSGRLYAANGDAGTIYSMNVDGSDAKVLIDVGATSLGPYGLALDYAPGPTGLAVALYYTWQPSSLSDALVRYDLTDDSSTVIAQRQDGGWWYGIALSPFL